jgi:RNA polymerase sigma factor (sigma-70 family)
MDSRRGRSRGVTTTLAAPITGSETRSTFEDLYRENRDAVYGYVAGMLGDRQAAEDVTAAAFERAYRRRHTFKARRGTRRAWLFGIARNAALDELRRRKRQAQLATEPPDEATADPADDAERLVRRTTVSAAVRELPPREREIVALKFAGGLTNSELARVLGVSESNAGTLLHRAMTKLREACNAPS